jgi:16S rRNA (guanine1207-N2)-methyltransferase
VAPEVGRMTEEEEPRADEPYWAERPQSRSSPSERRFLYRGELLTFTVDAGVFSSHGLDPGTALLIEHLRVGSSDRVLDLGCGWGPVGVAAAKASPQGHVVLTEVNRRAARLARQNLERNRVANAEVRIGPFFAPVSGEQFDVIATNPPYRIGRERILALLSEAREHLNPGGRLVLVGKGSHGIRFYQRWLEAHWTGPVEVLGRGSGYRVVEARDAPVSADPAVTPVPVRSAAVPAPRGRAGSGTRPAARSA